MNKTHKTDILILGAGIGGYETYRCLEKLIRRFNLQKKITIVDRNNYFTFTPLLHEVATGSVEPTHCAIPLRSLIKKPHTFIRGLVQKINPETKTVETDAGIIAYEYLVVAMGSSINFYNIPGAKNFAYSVRTLQDAIKLQQSCIDLLEGEQERIRIAIVGGSFTGVEIAGQFSHFARTDIAKLYPDKKIEINLIQSNGELTPSLTPKIRRYIRKQLEKEGVKIKLDSAVIEVATDHIILKDKTKIDTDLVVWTAGFENTAGLYLPDSACEKGRIPVNGFLQNPRYPTMYSVGDIMCGTDMKTNVVYPQLGEAAHKEGQYVAGHIVRTLQQKENNKSFHFKSRGIIVPLGNWRAVGKIGSFTIYGPIAWWLRRTAYILFFPGFFRKLKIIIDWTLHSLTHRYILDIGGKKNDY